MPIREYRCLECGGTIERVMTQSGDIVANLQLCPCLALDPDAGVQAEEVICAPSIRFKGPGFHRNDHGHSKDYTFGTDARTRMRQEITDARSNGELSPGESPFDSSTGKATKPAEDSTRRLILSDLGKNPRSTVKQIASRTGLPSSKVGSLLRSEVRKRNGKGKEKPAQAA